MGAELTKDTIKSNESIIVTICDCTVKDGKKRYEGSEIICFPRFENNPIILLKDDPNYKQLTENLAFNKQYIIKYIWSNKYNCYMLCDLTSTTSNIYKTIEPITKDTAMYV